MELNAIASQDVEQTSATKASSADKESNKIMVTIQKADGSTEVKEVQDALDEFDKFARSFADKKVVQTLLKITRGKRENLMQKVKTH